MRKYSIILFLFFSFFALSRNVSKDNFQNENQEIIDRINKFQIENEKLRIEIKTLNSKIKNFTVDIQKLQVQTDSNKYAIDQSKNIFETKIKKTSEDNNEKIMDVGQSISQKSLLGIIFILLVLLISGSLFWLLSKKQKTDKTNVEQLIKDTKKTLSKEGVRLDTKLVEILETQIKLIQEERIINALKSEESEIDHSLPLRVADEITRINAYANTLDPKFQDSKALKSSVKKLINTLKVSNYELVDLLGQKYNDGLKVIVVNAIPDNKLKNGEEIISNIIKPLVKFNGEQIQAAQVEISVGQ